MVPVHIVLDTEDGTHRCVFKPLEMHLGAKRGEKMTVEETFRM